MILLEGASTTLRVVTGSATNVDVVAFSADLASGAVTPQPPHLSAITTATTTVVVPAPGASKQRTIRMLSIRNKSASANTITVEVYNGATPFELVKFTLGPGESWLYDEANGVQRLNSAGTPLLIQTLGQLAPAVNTLNTVVLASDVTNNNAVANTIQDVTGLSFAVNAVETYWFEAVIDFTAAATATGSRWTINGPAFTKLAYWSQWALTETTSTLGNYAAYQLPAASNASSANTAGNIALIGGYITPSAAGTLQIQFASEVASSAIVARAGSLLRWMRTV